MEPMDFVPMDYDYRDEDAPLCDEDARIIELIDYAQSDIAKARCLANEFAPEVEDKFIAAYELLLGAKVCLLGGFVQVHEPHRRATDEIIAAEEEFCERAWYLHHINSRCNGRLDEGECPEDIRQGAYAAAQRIEDKYGVETLDPEEDFYRGMLFGKLSALRWVLGADWDFLDT